MDQAVDVDRRVKLLSRAAQLLSSDTAWLAEAGTDELEAIVQSLEQGARDVQRYGHAGATWADSNDHYRQQD